MNVTALLPKKCLKRGVVLVLLLLTSSCSSLYMPPPTLPEPLRPPRPAQSMEGPVGETNVSSGERRPRFSNIPRPSTLGPSLSQMREEPFTPVFGVTGPLSINVEGLPLPAFINEIFGNLLGLSFEIDATIQPRRELVTLRINEAQLPKQLYNLARQVLTNYGVGIQWQGDLMRFVPIAQSSQPLPLMVSGLASPEVPPTHRPIFQFIHLKAVKTGQVKTWIDQAYKGQPLQIFEDVARNAIILLGPAKLVSEALSSVNILDQPFMRGQNSIRIDPIYLPASDLAQQLVQILSSQGYAVTQNPAEGGTLVLPFPQSNMILVFASDAKMLLQVRQWVEELDRFEAKGDKPTLFYYLVKNTTADSLSEVLNSIVGQSGGLANFFSAVGSNTNNTPISNAPAFTPTPASQATQSPLAANVTTYQSSRQNMFVVDKHRNALLFFGTGEEWSRILPVLRNMDTPPKQVLVEATVAEITLNDDEEHGIEWVINNAGLGGLQGRLSTLGLGVGSSGLTYTLSNAGQIRAVLNAFASNSQATILSTPRVMVRSGSSATITVGSQIPTLTSQSTTNQQQGGDSAILQSIQYRNTGITLTINPTVYAGRRVDLTISQEVSEAQPNRSSNINSPIILNRQVDTELSLDDGSSILLGGLISNNQSQGWSGVPILSDIPILGHLFRIDKQSRARTELVILITPYVIDDEKDARDITDIIKNRLELLPVLLPGHRSNQENKDIKTQSLPTKDKPVVKEKPLSTLPIQNKPRHGK